MKKILLPFLIFLSSSLMLQLSYGGLFIGLQGGPAFLSGTSAQTFAYDPTVDVALSSSRPDSSFMGGISFGYQFNQGLPAFLSSASVGVLGEALGATSASGFYRVQTWIEGHYSYPVSSHALFGFGRLVFPGVGRVHPDLAAGVGYAWNKMGDFVAVRTLGQSATYYKGQTEGHFAYFVAAGLTFDATSNVDMFIHYQFSNLGSISPTDSIQNVYGSPPPENVPEFAVKVQSVVLGVDIHF